MNSKLNIKNILQIPLLLYLFAIGTSALLPFQRPVLLLFVLVFIVFLFVTIRKQKFYLNNQIKIALIFFMYAMVSLFWADNVSHRVFKTIQAFLPAVLLFLITSSINVNVRNLLWASTLGFATLSLYSLFNLSDIYLMQQYQGITGEQNPNAVALPLGLGLFTSFALLKDSNRLQRMVLFIIFMVVFIILIITQSRTALLAVIMSMFSSYAIINSKKIIKSISGGKISKKRIKLSFRILLTFITISISLLVLFKYLNYDFTSHRIFSMFQNKANNYDQLSSNRTVIWGNGLDLQKNFLFGSGFATFEYDYQNALGAKTNPHNTYLDVFHGLGLFGLIYFLFFLFSLVISYEKIIYKYQDIYLFFVFYIIYTSFGNDVLEESFFWLVWFFAVAIQHQFQKQKHLY